MRLFAALIPPEEALDELAEALAPVRASWPGLRWLSRGLWHVTLAFYGELDEEALQRLLPGLEQAARGHALDLSLAGAGAFPRGSARSRVVWAGVEGELRALAELAEAAVAAGEAAGARQDPHRDYHAHLTVARSRVPRDLSRLTGHLSGFAGAPWTAGELHLVRSHHGTPRYESLERLPLGRPKAPRSEGPARTNAPRSE
ncbi:RNA 2',3'-cyclic phosphodiesterase [Actinocorallia populi]|uniref:RNA 2',3'-cyclic phosphodiesterase n=1 Tax=Actinocorallia populi TaxID=2079200 RepID=UPI000D08DBEE|nr:RNA 2',3'-cyclic phosphodiesterase [Actinocorallia populi]